MPRKYSKEGRAREWTPRNIAAGLCALLLLAAGDAREGAVGRRGHSSVVMVFVCKAMQARTALCVSWASSNGLSIGP